MKSKNLLTLVIILSLFEGCTTYTKTLIYTSGAGCLGAGGTASVIAEPRTKNNVIANTALWCLIGGTITGVIGHLLFKDDPRNQRLDNMLFEKPTEPVMIQEPTQDKEIKNEEQR